jgi:hypothetical protein
LYFEQLRRSTSFETLAGARLTGMIWSGMGRPRSVSIAATSFDFFSLIGVQPVLGRMFTKDEDQPERGEVALLDAGFWTREMGGDANVLGRKIILDDKLYSIIGVVPQGVRFGFSHCEFGFVVQAPDNPAGEQLLSAEIVEDQFAMLAQ